MEQEEEEEDEMENILGGRSVSYSGSYSILFIV